MLIESTVAVRFPAGDNFCFSSALSHYRSLSTSEEVSGVHVTSRRLVHSDCFNTPWTRLQRLNGNFFTRRTSLIRNRTRASAEHLGSASDPVKQNGSPQYHPFEDVADSTTENSGDAHLTDAETTRTVIEQVIIGFDTTEMMKEMELSGTSEIAFGIDEIEDEDSDVEDDEDEEEEDDSYDDEWVNVLDDEDEKLGDWAKLDTMSSSHPMYFTKKLAEVASGDPVDWMEEPPAGLAIQGFLRPALIEENSKIQKYISSHQSHNADIDQVGRIVDNEPENLHVFNGYRHGSESSTDNLISEEEPKKVDIPMNGTSFYKLEMIKIHLILAHGYRAIVEVEDVRKAQPDAIVHSAAKIMSCLKAGGEKTTQALKSLCWRSKGIQVEEAALIAVDSLGFDLKVCSGTQIQTLRFAFKTRQEK